MIEAHERRFGEDRRRDLKRFKGKNTRDRLETLSERLGAASTFTQHFHSVSVARNILTHNAGIVRASECGDAATFTLSWVGIDIVVTAGDDGSEIVRHKGDAPFPKLAFPEGGQIGVHFVERTRRFNVGQAIVPTPHDLHEICVMYRREASRLVGAAATSASARNVSVGPVASSGAPDT